MQKFECKNCGAELQWDANAGSLKCKYCESEYQPSDFEDKTTSENIENKELDSNYTNAGGDLAEGMVVYACDECGAEVVTSKTTMATTCAYCGRSISITDKTAGNFRPEQVIPFSFDHDKAMEVFKKYTKSTFLTPKLFSEQHVIEKVQGLFVPFFLHSMKANSSAVVLGERHTSRRRGDDKITTVKIYEVNMTGNGTFKDVPTDASVKLENSLMDALEPFSYDKIQAFNPAYMAGFFAEQPDETVEGTVSRAKEKIETALNREILKNAGTFDTKTIKNSNHKYSNEKSKYAMLPIWLLNVDYKNKKYQYAINGETGKVVGKLPMSISKLVLSCGGFFVIANIISSIVLMFI